MGFALFDSGQIDPFELDHVIYHYSRSARELWKFCGNGESRIAWGVGADSSWSDKPGRSGAVRKESLPT